MLTKVICPAILALFILFNCADDDSKEVTQRPEPEIPEAEQDSSLSIDSTFSECDTFIAEHLRIGTACCISGYIVASLGDTATYHYQVNHPDAKVSWVILDGDISILAGKDSLTVTVLIGSNFTGGIIQALGSGSYDQTRLVCNDRIKIKALQ